MGKMIKALVSELTAFQKIVALVITILAAVSTSGAYFSGVLGLPEDVTNLSAKVEEHTVELEQNSIEHQTINSRLDKILCNQNPDMSWDQCELRYGGREY